MEDAEQFELWCQQWEKAEAKWAKEKPPQQPKPAGGMNDFFGSWHNDAPEGSPPKSEEVEDWRQIFDRCQQIIDDHPRQEGDVLNEFAFPPNPSWQQPWSPRGAYPGDGNQKNPIGVDTGGMDQSETPKAPVRVTPNFSDGGNLRELAKIRDRLSKLESALASAEFGLQEGDPQKLKKQALALAHRADQLSDKLSPPPLEDVA